MPKFDVFVEWKMAKTIEVEAIDLDKAIEKGMDRFRDADNDGDYLEGSFTVNEPITRDEHRDKLVAERKVKSTKPKKKAR